jgi:hypothetical protein
MHRTDELLHTASSGAGVQSKSSSCMRHSRCGQSQWLLAAAATLQVDSIAARLLMYVLLCDPQPEELQPLLLSKLQAIR